MQASYQTILGTLQHLHLLRRTMQSRLALSLLLFPTSVKAGARAFIIVALPDVKVVVVSACIVKALGRSDASPGSRRWCCAAPSSAGGRKKTRGIRIQTLEHVTRPCISKQNEKTLIHIQTCSYHNRSSARRAQALTFDRDLDACSSQAGCLRHSASPLSFCKTMKI